MNLTQSQKSALKTLIDNTPAYSSVPNTQDGALALANLLNSDASPAFTVWRTSVDIGEIMNNGFAWDRVDNATVGQARIWEWLKELGSINPSKANVRAGIDAAWPGTPNQTQRDGIYSHCSRNASAIEKLFATGTGTPASPGTLVFEGPVYYLEVFSVRNP